MKKKAIEQVPYMVPERKEGCKYVARANVLPIGGTETLLVEIFEKSDTPKIRTVVTRNDYAGYDPEKKKWNRIGIDTGLSRSDDYYWKFRYGMNAYIPKTDVEKIEKFTKDYKNYSSNWVSQIKAMQDNIRYERTRKLEAKRSVALADRIENTPELPEESIKWAKKILTGHRLFYRRKGNNKVLVYCSACEKTTEARCKESEDPYNFERVIKPQNNREGICPECGAKGIWKSYGRAGEETVSLNFYVGMPYKENGAVIRYCKFGKIFLPPKDKDFKTSGESESFFIFEIARQYFCNNKIIKDYHKLGSAGDYWDDRNYQIYGPTIQVKAAYVYPGTWESLKGTCLQYSGAKEFAGDDKVCLMDYMENYTLIPQLEMISKFGLTVIAHSIARYNRQEISNIAAKNIGDFLGIYKEDFKILQEVNGDIETLHVLKMERALGQRWTKYQINFLVQINASREDIFAAQLIGIQRFINKVEKYAGTKLEDCKQSCQLAHMIHVAKTYTDYINMRQNGGYDMQNTVYLYPRDLELAHARMVTMQNERLRQAAEGKAELAYPNISRAYESLNRWYYYEYKDWIIRPARSATEIIEEGREMHHCVGGSMYLGRHNKGESYILLMRWKDAPEIPYVTIEIEGTRIKQWYQKNDKKPDAAIIDPWLKRYVKMLKGKEEPWAMCS